jgi:type I restriction enzyme M protein
VLFIDARKLGTMVDRRHRELTAEDIEKISNTYRAWRGESDKKYQNIRGFCKSASLDEIGKQQWILTPGRYVGAEEEEDDGEAFDEKMKRLTSELSEQMKQSQTLDHEIKKKLDSIGFRL